MRGKALLQRLPFAPEFLFVFKVGVTALLSAGGARAGARGVKEKVPRLADEEEWLLPDEEDSLVVDEKSSIEPSL
jgi:hypothetical protein